MNLLLKVFFILSLFIFVLLRFSPLSYATHPSVSILMYHYIRDYNNPRDTIGNRLSVSPSNFDQQMGYLASHGYTPISLDTMYAIFNGQAQSPSKPIVLTFDDGYIDFYANAFPILKKYGLHAVEFIPTGLIGQPAYMSWNNIKEIQQSGLVTFEGHTVSHSYLPKLGSSSLLRELQESKTTLQSQTGYTVNFIAYPYGASNWTVQNAAQKAGYVGGVGTWGGKTGYGSMNMPRIRINGGDSLQTFAIKL